MCTAQRCPVCDGDGNVQVSDPYGADYGSYIQCHCCGGSGMVIVHCIHEPRVILTIDGLEGALTPDTIGGRED